MGQPVLTILVIDDSPEDRATIRHLLTQDDPASYQLLDADSGETGLRLWRERQPDCVLINALLPDTSGLQVLVALAEHSDGSAPAIMLSGTADPRVATEALKLGAQDYLPKDQITTDSLRRAITYTLEKSRLLGEQQRTLAALREREQFISAVLNTTPNLLYVHDLVADRNAFMNDQIERLSGYTAAEHQAQGGELFNSLVHPRDRSGLRAHFDRLQRAGDDEVLEHEFRFRHRDGSWRWLSSRDRVFSRDPNGKVLASLGIANDITARRQAEERLRLFEQVVINMNDALLITEAEPIDEPGPRIVYANPAFTRMTGYSLEEVLGKNPRILQGPDSSRAELEKIRRALKRWRSTRVELVNYRRDGSMFDVEFDVVPIADATGWYTHWISVQRETTQRKRAEAERVQLLAQAQQARDMAEEAVRVRDQFLSIAAHELKNPLTVLLGNTQLLERRAARTSALPEPEQRMLRAIREQADRLNELITSLFDVSRIEMGQLQLTQAPLELSALVRRIVEELQPTLTRHTLSFSGPAEPLVLEGDALRLEQVVQNLLGNAIKYSPAGGPITVQVERHTSQGCITVTDHGIGIPSAALPYLFRRFYRADNTRRQHIPGTGVGLYVVKEIVARHGGEVLVSSIQGEGSSFTVCLPLRQEQPFSEQR